LKYRIFIHRRADADAHSMLLGISDISKEAAVRWYQHYLQAIETLEEFPERCPKIPEPHLFDVAVRHLLFGTRRRRFRIVFAVSGGAVHIFRIRHWARAPIGPDELMSGDV